MSRRQSDQLGAAVQRTHQTAAPLAKHLGLEPILEADLREVYLGEWEGGALRKHALPTVDDVMVAARELLAGSAK